MALTIAGGGHIAIEYLAMPLKYKKSDLHHPREGWKPGAAHGGQPDSAAVPEHRGDGGGTPTRGAAELKKLSFLILYVVRESAIFADLN
jgi:hypothetical protein